MRDTKIEWTDHTANFWWGCFKVSPGCANCYAEALSKRYGRDIWGPPTTTERWRTKGPWRDILRWDAEAGADGVRRRVFVQSMSDFFEDHPQLPEWRAEAIEILGGLRHLDVQLLTKRPSKVLRMVPGSWLREWPSHVWIGTSVENQAYANDRIPELLNIPAAVRFLSCEPLLSRVDLHLQLAGNNSRAGRVQWVIVGGESGPKARPMHPDWARSIRDQCQEAGVPFFFKQAGEWTTTCPPLGTERNQTFNHGRVFYRVGRKQAGRLLDGREWNEFPVTQEAA